ncbi:MAG: prephenate dehydrogenase [Hydrogenibacillus schlegelii]|uniref:Prephenate dehydrogenase n=1 Tax=Hydrogenibacillus schlegelii TaxID=1484 RepID=A0A947GC55_HYDSH|nr:prephenate dehydrogenase [Hydrogenibacillus schlegelii]
MTERTEAVVVGMGLIGGSIAAVLRARGLRVSGVDRLVARAERAAQRGLIDRALRPEAAEAAYRAADLIVLALPVLSIVPALRRLAEERLKPGVIVTDVGSTKRSIVAEAEALFAGRDVRFIGGHPMAGSHKSGVEAAHPDLFENAYYVLCPSRLAEAADVERLKDWLAPARVKWLVMDPAEHDRVVAVISHLPHVVAALLVQMLARREAESPYYALLAAGGFKDLTRIAASNPEMWRDIVLDNRAAILAAFEEWETDLRSVRAMLEAEDGPALEAFFAAAARYRARLPERRPGAIRPAYDLFVDIPDRPGEIGRLATRLGAAGINLTNLEILELREDVFGVLRLAFRNDRDRERAAALLVEAGYPVYAFSNGEMKAFGPAGGGEGGRGR